MNRADYLLDLNVVLDLLQNRIPYADHSEALFSATQEQRVRLWVSGDAPSTLFYLLERQFRQSGHKGASALAQGKLRGVLDLLEVAPVNRSVLDTAFSLGMDDFEDAIQAGAALEAGVGVLVTRDQDGYRNIPPGSLAVLSPPEALALL